MNSQPRVVDFVPPADNPLTALNVRVTEAIRALPAYFRSATNIEGIQATDLFSLNSMLATTIEVQVVHTLNSIRDVWDPHDEWPTYWFVRQPQTFPDVLLREQTATGHNVALGIELKGWYVLSLEGTPSFRYSVTPDGCSLWDILVVVPWHLSNILSGTPNVNTPGIWSAKYVATYRNWWWQHGRSARSDTTIHKPPNVVPYQRREHTSDKPVSDRGGNFGRIARTGIMDDWIRATLANDLAGVSTKRWLTFLGATNTHH